MVAGQPLTGDLLANDGDEDGDALTVTTDDSPEVTVASDGTFTWTPPSPGIRTFTYTVSDGAASSTATVVITVTAAPPVQQALFLIGSPTGTRGVLSPTAPGAGGDWDGDGSPGLTIHKSGLKEDEDNPDRFHEWDYVVPAGGVVLDGPVRLELSSRTRAARPDGRPRRLLDLAVQLRRGRHVVRPVGRRRRRARRRLEPRARLGGPHPAPSAA